MYPVSCSNSHCLFVENDILFGTLATLISCLLMVLVSKLIKSLFISGLIPCFVNALIVPFIIYLGSMNTSDAFNLSSMYWIMFGWVLLGEFACIICIGYPLFYILIKKVNGFNKILCFERNLDFKR